MTSGMNTVIDPGERLERRSSPPWRALRDRAQHGRTPVAKRSSQAALVAVRVRSVRSDVTDVGDGKLIATVSDADGNLIGLLQMP